MNRFHRRQLAVLALLIPAASAMAQATPPALEVSPDTAIHSPYALDNERHIVRDGSGQCVHNGTWSADDAAATHLSNGQPAGCACDAGALPQSVCAPPAPVALTVEAPPPAEAPIAPPAPQQAARPPLQHVSLPADALFDFDQDHLSAQGQAALDELIAKLQHVQVSQVTAVGHADRIGSPDYNLALSERRALAVEDYLVAHAGLRAEVVQIEARGAAEPITGDHCDALGPDRRGNARLIECLAPDRRVDVDVYGAQPPVVSQN